MNLRLQYPPTPDFAEKHAEVAISAVQDVDGVALDYSPTSLRVIDRIIQRFRQNKLKESHIAETLFSFGCYAGEVLVKNLGGAWAHPKDVMPPEAARLFPFMVVKMPDGRVWNPIGKAFKQLENGEADCFEYLYAVASKP